MPIVTEKAARTQNIGGKEYVLQIEFAERCGVSKQTANKFFSRYKEKIEVIKIDGLRDNYYNYKQAIVLWDRQRRNKNDEVPYKRTAKDYIKLTAVGDASVSLPSIPEEKMEERMVNPRNIIDLDSIDPNDFKDCWVIDPTTNDAIYHPITNQPMIDYDKLKTRLTSEKYNFDLNEKRGLYVEKEVAKRYLTGMAKILETALEAIPRRYTAQIVAECSNITGHQFTAEENATLRAILKNEAPAIMTSLQTEITKMMDEGGEE